MIGAIRNRVLTAIAPWLKWWPLAAVLATGYTVWTVRGWKEGSDNAAELKRQIAGIHDKLQHMNAAAAKTEADREFYEKRNRDLQRSLTRDEIKTLDACPVPDGILRALEASRVRAATGQPDR